MRLDSYPHQWGTCRSPVIFAGEEPGNYFPLLFRDYTQQEIGEMYGRCLPVALAKQRPKRSVDQIYTCVDLQSEKAGLYLSMPPPKDRAHGCCCCQWLHFLENMQQHLRDFAEVPLRLSESDSCELPENGYRFADSYHGGYSQGSGGIGISAKGKEKGICEKKFIYRNGETA